MIGIQPQLSRMYSTCFPDDLYGNTSFELLGFDIILEKLDHGHDVDVANVSDGGSNTINSTTGSSIKPWLLEVFLFIYIYI